MVRPDSPRRSCLPPGTEMVESDFKDPLSLPRSCRGISTVISTVNSVARRIGEDSLETVDRTGQKQLVRAARDAGVARFVYVSVSPGSADCPFVRVKREVEEVVRGSGMEWVILQPTAFMEIWLSPRLGWEVSRGRVRVFGDGRKRTSLVSLEDVAGWAVVAALAPKMAGRVFPLCGPDPLSPLEIVRMAEELTRQTFRVRHIPLPLVKAAATLLRRPNPILSSLLRIGIGIAERGEVLAVPGEGAGLPPPRVTVRAFLERVAGAA
jgi:uncharacterized protein YbjT (DUF2867 family)